MKQGLAQNIGSLWSKTSPWTQTSLAVIGLASTMVFANGAISPGQVMAEETPTTSKQHFELRPYRVRLGDTLDSIARIYNLRPRDIIRINQLDPNNILQVGQVIVLPQSSTRRANSVNASAPGFPGKAIAESTRRPSQAASSAPTTRFGSAHYVNQLKNEVLELRQRQIAQPPAAPPQRSRIVASASLGSESYEPLAQSMLRQSVGPELPPLTSTPFLDNASGYIWPTAGVITSGFGWRWGRMHQGLDIAAASGTPIYAAARGVVTYAGWSGGYGNLVEIAHTDGSITRYGHNRRNLVRKGQRVNQGEQIAEMGSTGRSTGPHLHFEVHTAGQGAVNPLSHLDVRNPHNHDHNHNH